ncbi:MAG: 1-acyl-sn-glycerol-3-phosphate acyltransferase [Clostridia bacterium]|nr:1-acyl-sn-glycerol-3-phosphate acyltransferase [Clostridia bacterium]
MAKKEKNKLTKFEKWFRSLHRFVNVVYRPFYPYKIHKPETPYEDRPYIIIGNHLSLFDPVLAAMATKKPIHFMAKKELFEKGLMKKFVNKCECIPVYRDGGDMNAVIKAMKYLKNGESIGIFPEGKRNRTGERLLPFKSGATALSIKTKTPIIPFVMVKKIKFGRTTHALYGEPYEFTEYYGKKLTEEDIKTCDEILRQKILELYEQLLEMLSKKKKKHG